MSLLSDLQIESKKFRSDEVSEQTRSYNAKLINLMSDGPKWYEVGAEKYRQMRWNGETPMPKPTIVESANNITLPSREPGRSIPCRIFKPLTTTSKGLFYHIHGGGWVLQSEAYQDSMLQHYADKASLTVLSIGYRLAPEQPYPAGNEDCFDIGIYLVDHSERDFGVPMLFLGGESAGAHLSTLTCFKLLETRPNFAFKGLVLSYGVYNIAAALPQVHNFDLPLVLTKDIMVTYIDAYLPNVSPEERRDPWISPFFADLSKMKLPPALFCCGTLDLLLDDTVMMSTRWMMSGNEAILKTYPGAPHNFTTFPVGGTETTEEALRDIASFLVQQNP